MLNKGDKVSVLDDAIDGVVVKVNGNEVTIETTDGFNLEYKSSELIKIENGNAMNFSFNKSQVISEKEVAKPNYTNTEKKNNLWNSVAHGKFYMTFGGFHLYCQYIIIAHRFVVFD